MYKSRYIFIGISFMVFITGCASIPPEEDDEASVYTEEQESQAEKQESEELDEDGYPIKRKRLMDSKMIDSNLFNQNLIKKNNEDDDTQKRRPVKEPSVEPTDDMYKNYMDADDRMYKNDYSIEDNNSDE